MVNELFPRIFLVNSGLMREITEGYIYIYVVEIILCSVNICVSVEPHASISSNWLFASREEMTENGGVCLH